MEVKNEKLSFFYKRKTKGSMTMEVTVTSSYISREPAGTGNSEKSLAHRRLPF